MKRDLRGEKDHWRHQSLPLFESLLLNSQIYLLNPLIISPLPGPMPPVLLLFLPTDGRPGRIRHGLEELPRESGARALGLLAHLVLHVLQKGRQVGTVGGKRGRERGEI